MNKVKQKKTPVIKNRTAPKPKCKPDKFGRLGWVISVSTTQTLFYFYGTEKQAENERAKIAYQHKGRGYKRYASKSETKNQKAERGFKQNENIYTTSPPKKTFVTYMHESGLNVSDTEASVAYQKAQKRLEMNQKLSKIAQRNRDRDLEQTRKMRQKS